MKKIRVEWQHLVENDETCQRCSVTKEHLLYAIEYVNKELITWGISVYLVETELNSSQIQFSNRILVEDKAIEDILDLRVSMNHCQTCSTIIGYSTCCRTILYNEKQYEEVPVEAIIEAIYRYVNLPLKTVPSIYLKKV